MTQLTAASELCSLNVVTKSGCDIGNTILWLTESHLFTDGGYPYDWDMVDGELVIAGLDYSKEGNGTVLFRYLISDVESFELDTQRFLEGELEEYGVLTEEDYRNAYSVVGECLMTVHEKAIQRPESSATLHGIGN